jgi:hypothetical protein
VANKERSARDIVVAPISPQDAKACVKRIHYSHSTASNSQLHFGVFLDGVLEGAMQFGPSLDKRKMLGLVRDSGWNGFLELNRMAFSDKLPRNSESRALGFALRAIRKAYPHIEWIVSFADGTQCGDGTIYRASGFVLTGISKNKTIWVGPDGEKGTDLSLKEKSINRHTIESSRSGYIGETVRVHPRVGAGVAFNGGSSMAGYRAAGWRPMPGFQLRYIFFLNPAARARLTVPEIPFSKIEEIGAGMYRGVARGKQAMAGSPSHSGAAAATSTLQRKKGPGLSRGQVGRH